MSTRASLDDGFERARVAARGAYERGRVRAALLHATTFVLVSAALSLAFVGQRSLAWLPLSALAWAFVEWRGVGILRGARLGALAGLVTLVLPMSILRPCCKPGMTPAMGGDCCTMPGVCAAAGAVVGLVLAAFVPVYGKRRDTLVGMVLGLTAVAPMKCVGLLGGEALGLVAGLYTAVVAGSVVRSWLSGAAAGA